MDTYEARIPGVGLPTAGADASERWRRALGVASVLRWHAEIAIISDSETSFELNIYSNEWGFAFHHDRRGSWIRVTDIAFVHGRDDFGLLTRTPDLLAIRQLAAELEVEHGISLRRANASIRTNLPGAAELVRDWLVQAELCNDEMYGDIRCTKPKNHDGHHEYVANDARGQLRWK